MSFPSLKFRCSQDSVVGIVTTLDDARFDFRQCLEDFSLRLKVQIDFVAHIASYSVCAGDPEPGVKQPGRGAYHSRSHSI